MRVLATAMLALCACGDERAVSEGSVLEPPREWLAEARPTGEALDFHALAPGVGLPQDILSVTLVAQAQSRGSGELALGVRDDGGRWLVDPEQPEQSANRALRGGDRVVAMLPSSSAALPLAADYLIAPALLSGARRAVALSAWVKRGRGGRQELPLALVVAATIDDGPIDLALVEVGRIWRAAGIEVREPVRFHVQGPQAERLGRVEVDPALASESPMVAQALALSSLAPARTLSLIVVGDLAVTGGPGYPIWALSAGIPVSPASDAAILVSAVLLKHDPSWAGQVVAHEIGHALGLYHTTEAVLDGATSISDQIDDTRACPASADRSPADQVLSPGECDRHDTANLMFWSAVRGATLLTSGQAALARRSALPQ
jgi:hypothetical protein